MKRHYLNYEEFIDLAKANYNKGGDTFFECWDKNQYDFYVSEFGKMTKTRALKMFKAEAKTNHQLEDTRINEFDSLPFTSKRGTDYLISLSAGKIRAFTYENGKKTYWKVTEEIKKYVAAM